MEVKINVVEAGAIKLEQVKALYHSCAWDWLELDSEMEKAFQGSFRIFNAYVDDRLVGFARILGDGKIYGFLVDVMIAPSYRNRGIAYQLVAAVEKLCQKDGIKIMQLLSSSQGKGLYKKAGFDECPADAPGMMKLLAPQTE